MNEVAASGAMDSEEMRRRINGAMVARLATVGRDGRPHIVPITFALDHDTIHFVIDFKPKKTADLQRLRNIEANPSVAVLSDHYEEDWTRLWWVRADGSARIVIDGAMFEKGIALLTHRDAQYLSAPPAGPVGAARGAGGVDSDRANERLVGFMTSWRRSDAQQLRLLLLDQVSKRNRCLHKHSHRVSLGAASLDPRRPGH